MLFLSVLALTASTGTDAAGVELPSNVAPEPGETRPIQSSPRIEATQPAIGRSLLGFEVDPVPFFEHGFSIHAGFKSELLPRWRFTLGAFGLSAKGSGINQGWDTTERALEVSTSYILFSRRSGLFIGLYVFAERWTYALTSAADQTHVERIAPCPALGFQWLLWRGIYVTPWIALGKPIDISGSHIVASRAYEEPKWQPVVALHVGVEFPL